MMKNPDRTTLLINCSLEEAEQIRAAARKEQRTISAYVLRAVRARMTAQEHLEHTQYNFFVSKMKAAGK